MKRLFQLSDKGKEYMQQQAQKQNEHDHYPSVPFDWPSDNRVRVSRITSSMHGDLVVLTHPERKAMYLNHDTWKWEDVQVVK